ncbi:MAG: Cytoplasmic and mitochondrial histidine tRNA synthetase [Chaenotheca gracillima]|nr:MAG: Cytoplasmic and mitochondrial histidine tRNA synthetase [Chaenotheca gracillima]
MPPTTQFSELDTIPDSPAKRRKTNSHGGTGYNSQEDSGDDLFEEYETVETVPLPKPSHLETLSTQHQSSLAPIQEESSQHGPNKTSPHFDGSGRRASIVQVAASSPLRPPSAVSSPASRPSKSGGLLAGAMAPAGTRFRLPHGTIKRPQSPVVIDISDDEAPKYRGHSSDEDACTTRRNDIKPSVFNKTGKDAWRKDSSTDKVDDSPQRPIDKFKTITAGSFYRPVDKSKPHGSALSGSIYDSRNRDDGKTSSTFATTAPPKRSSDVLANAYGGSSRQSKQAKQSRPERAQPVEDISLDDIPDFNLRKNIGRIRQILPNSSVLACKNALLNHMNNVDDAMEELTAQENAVDLTVSEDDLSKTSPMAAPAKPNAKRQVKAPNRSIQAKWSSTQILPKSQEAYTGASPKVQPPKPRKKLVQGRRNASSPAVESPKPPSRQETPELDSDTDSGVGDVEEDQTELEGKVLAFFNACTVKDLADISNNTEEIAGVILALKPFKSLEEVRQISTDVPSKNKSSKRKSTRKAIGDRVVETCLEMWTGYEAVDELVTKCEALGKPVADEMQKWGFDVFGAAKDGELAAVNMNGAKSDSKGSVHDSGLGTPSNSSPAPLSDDQEGEIKSVAKTSHRNVKNDSFIEQPSNMGKDTVLKDYQLVGLNWLALLFDKGLSCILADEMGLGKTCQVIAFLAHLLTKGVKGPHLVVVPGSTLENWLREFRRFCPELVVEPYYGLQAEREDLRDKIETNIDSINVIVTTYDLASNKLDSKFLRHLKPCVCVYDEGHALRNSTSKRYEALMRIPARFRLLLTGTPLQNNLRELAALLGFILPSLFKERKEDLEYIFKHRAKTNDDNHAALLSAQRIARARSMMTPFVLRRKKHQVLKSLPKKTTRVEYCDITPAQFEVYNRQLESARQAMEERANGIRPKKANANVLMQLRKAAIHPLLFRQHFNDDVIRNISREILKEPELSDRDPEVVLEEIQLYSDFDLHEFCAKYPSTLGKYNFEDERCMDSGKVQKLVDLLLTYRSNGDRVLVFSQFTMVLDILEAVLQSIEMQYFRFDGQTKIEMRQDMIDEFYDDEDISVFLLSTRAGGTGINLACANKVIIFDSSFNPQDDIQAENRAHRVGQTREVEVVRLVTKGTIEEQIHSLGETKLALDDRVAGEGATEKEVKDAEEEGIEMVAKMWVGEKGVSEDKESEAVVKK